MVWKIEAGAINALMRTLLINVRAVIQLTFHQTKTRMLYYVCNLRRFSTMDKGRASSFEASTVTESLLLFCRVKGVIKKGLFWAAFFLNVSQCAENVRKIPNLSFCFWGSSRLFRRSRENASFVNKRSTVLFFFFFFFLPSRCFCSGNTEVTR